jgi:hypothetical protein
MTTLIQILKSETQSLKEQYLLKTKEWSINYYNSIEVKKTWKEVDWCKYFNLEPRVANAHGPASQQFLTFPSGFYNTSNSKEYRKLRNEIHSLLTMGLEKYIAKELKYAEMHYETSIEKLAFRIEKKGLNQEKLNVVTSHIGININTTLTDGDKIVRAFTIIAEGEIQRPHYRYLIK